MKSKLLERLSQDYQRVTTLFDRYKGLDATSELAVNALRDIAAILGQHALLQPQPIPARVRTLRD